MQEVLGTRSRIEAEESQYLLDHFNVTKGVETSGITLLETDGGQLSYLALFAQVVCQGREEACSLEMQDSGPRSCSNLFQGLGPVRQRIMRPCLAPLPTRTPPRSIHTAEHKFPLTSIFLDLAIYRKGVKKD